MAPDGQRIVDQRGEFTDERREMERKADLVETTAREQRSHEPSTRFWGSRYAQAGPLLALFAGLFTLAIRTWPIATPQGRGTIGTAWFICATIAGAMYVAGFFLSDRHWKRARMVLVSAALLHLVVGFLAATQVDAQEVAPAWRSLFFDAAPAVAALIAAFLIGPRPESTASRELLGCPSPFCIPPMVGPCESPSRPGPWTEVHVYSRSLRDSGVSAAPQSTGRAIGPDVGLAGHRSRSRSRSDRRW